MNCAFVPCLATRLLRRAAFAVVASLVAFVSSAFAQPAAPQNLRAKGATIWVVELNWTDTSTDETGFVVERGDGTTFTPLVLGRVPANITSYRDEYYTDPDTTYWYRVRAVGGDRANPVYSSYSNIAAGRTLLETPPSSPWTGWDVGQPVPAGSSSANPPALTMTAGGTDIFGTADAFRYHAQTAKGDMTIVARVDSMTNSNPWAKAGVMIRASLKPDSANAAMLLSAGAFSTFQARIVGAEETIFTSGGYYNAPYWVKLTREGQLFSGYLSADGTNWRFVGSQEIEMPYQVYVGVAGCSHNPGTATTISFSNVGLTVRPPPVAPSGLQATLLSTNRVRLTWNDNSNDEEGFTLYAQMQPEMEPSDMEPYDEPETYVHARTAPNVTSLEFDLHHETTYSFGVAAVRGQAVSFGPWIKVKTPQSPNSPPHAPRFSDAQAHPSALGTAAIRFAWYDENTNETGWVVERATEDEPTFVVVGTTGVDESEYIDDGLVDGKTYSYRVRAVNNAGSSDYSPVASTVAFMPPSAPTGLTITARTDTSISLAWTDPNGTERGYGVRRYTSAGAFDGAIWLEPNATSVTDTGLTPGTTYNYRVHAYNNRFDSPAATVTASTTGGGAPSSGWTGRDVGSVGVAGSATGAPPTVTMKAGGADIFGTSDGFHSMFQAATGDATIVARVTSLTNTHPWAKAGVMIRASLDANAANAAMLLTAGNVSVFQARTVAGNETLNTNGAWVRAPYWVKLTRAGNTFRGYISADGAAWTLVGTQDIPMSGEIYVGLAGTSHNAATLTDIAFTNVEVTTASSTSLAAPTDFTANNLTARSVRLAWVDRSGDEDGFRIYGGRVDAGAGGMTLLTQLGANVTSYDLTGLIPDTNYNVGVVAFRGSTEAGGAWINFSTPQAGDAPPAAPDDLTVIRSAPNTLEVRWPDRSTTETGFQIERGNTDGSFTRVGTVGANVTSYTESGLTSGVTYVYRVRAVNAAGASAYSPVGSAQANGAPANPTAISIGTRTDSTLQVNWTDASADETGFKLERASYGSNFAVIATLGANVTTYTDTGLYVGFQYSYRVRAFNSGFDSGYSPVATGETTGGGGGSVLPSMWTGVNIGNATGSESAQYPPFTMRASGRDIYGTADDFRFWYQTEEGDLTMVARISSMTNTDPWAKAGLMIRASGQGAGAANVAILLTPANGALFQARAAVNGVTTHKSGPAVRAPQWVKLTRVGNLFSGYVSADGTTWTLVGTQEVAMPWLVFVGFAGCSHKPGTEILIGVDQFDLTVPSSEPPTSYVWTRHSWNAASSSATPNAAGDAMVITGKSPDIWGASDGGTYMYRTITDDDMLAVTVDSVTRADPYSKAGMMARATLDAGSQNVAVVVTPDRGLFLQVRQTSGGVTTLAHEVPGVRPPVQLWMGRWGNRFIASYSADNGATWHSAGEVNVVMPDNIFLGPVASSHNASVESTATFSEIADE